MKTAAILKLRDQLAAIVLAAGSETTVAQTIVLLEVALRPGEMITHLAESLPIDGTHTLVSRTADVLGTHQGRRTRRESAGLLERRDVLEDRRAQGLWLTKLGEKLMEKLS